MDIRKPTVKQIKDRLAQKKRRQRERAWLWKEGYTSWEAIHTAIMKGELILLRPTSSFMKKNAS